MGDAPDTPDANGVNEPIDVKQDHNRLEWTMVGTGITGLLSVLAIAFSIVALAAKTPGTGTATAATPSADVVSGTPAVQPATMTIGIKADDEHGRLGPDHQWHDAFLPADFAVHPGQQVTITFVNYDGGPHSFTSPALGVNEIVPGGGSLAAPKRVTFTFTAPAKPGTYQWWCAVPCDPWAMAHDGYMRGVVTVTA